MGSGFHAAAAISPTHAALVLHIAVTVTEWILNARSATNAAFIFDVALTIAGRSHDARAATHATLVELLA